MRNGFDCLDCEDVLDVKEHHICIKNELKELFLNLT